MIKYNDLFFFVFGINPELINTDIDKCIKICAGKAYLDLCRTLRFKYSSKQLEENKDKEFIKKKEEYVQKIIDIIIKNIKEFINKNDEIKYNSEQFDKWHKCLSGEVKNTKSDIILFKENEGLNYGHVQKWINMTFKYLIIMGVIDSKECFHIPLDDFIIAAASKTGRICESFDVEGLSIERTIEKWSKISEYDDYYKYEKIIREKVQEKYYGKMNPIDWEGHAWMAEATIRSCADM